MSSLAASRADGYYYDPLRFDPKKRGRDTVNGLAGSHPLGERAKRLKSEGVLVIRFEMPYDCWCLGCGMHIARGVRFNADKKKAGNYFSTPIWEFSFKCTNGDGCNSQIVIRTDPQSSDYVFVAGARKKDRGDDGTGEGDVIVQLEATVSRGHARGDTLSGVEASREDARKAAAQAEQLLDLAEQSERRYGRYRDGANTVARQSLRERALQARIAAAEGASAGLTVPLAAPSPEASTGGITTSSGTDAHHARHGEYEDEADEQVADAIQSTRAAWSSTSAFVHAERSGHGDGDDETGKSMAYSRPDGAVKHSRSQCLSTQEKNSVLATSALPAGPPQSLLPSMSPLHRDRLPSRLQQPGPKSTTHERTTSQAVDTALQRVGASQAGVKLSNILLSGMAQVKAVEKRVQAAAAAVDGRRRILGGPLMAMAASCSGQRDKDERASALIARTAITLPVGAASSSGGRLVPTLPLSIARKSQQTLYRHGQSIACSTMATNACTGT